MPATRVSATVVHCVSPPAAPGAQVTLQVSDTTVYGAVELLGSHGAFAYTGTRYPTAGEQIKGAYSHLVMWLGNGDAGSSDAVCQLDNQ